MKRLMAIMVLVVAVPAMATVNITATDAGNGKLQIAYASPEGDAPRGIALRISCSDGATVDMANLPVPGVDINAAFNTFIDYVYSNPLADPFGAAGRHPFAKSTEAGALALDAVASDFSVSMGVLDNTGAQGAGPTTAAPLITIQLKKGTADQTTVTITADTLRGPASGVVGSVLDSTMPAPVVVAFGSTDCVKGTASFFADWVAWGKPACWCFERQCRGDINGKKDGAVIKYWVSGADLTLFKNGYAKTDAVLKTISGGICGDLNHKADGAVIKYRVSGADLTNFKLYYAKADASVPSCDIADYNFWMLP